MTKTKLYCYPVSARRNPSYEFYTTFAELDCYDDWGMRYVRDNYRWLRRSGLHTWQARLAVWRMVVPSGYGPRFIREDRTSLTEVA